jgi:glutathione S-transferase
MELVYLIIILALAEYIFFGAKTGLARVKYQVKAPAISGHPMFERFYRVQMNTLEQLIIFIPALLVFSWSGEGAGWPANEIAAGLGVIWIIGRAIYYRSYIGDPATRGLGFGMTILPSMAMLLGAFIAILLSLL